VNLYEALSIPFIRGAETVFDPGRDAWVRRFEYPEIAGCAIETGATLDGLRDLEIARVARIVELMASGRPVPRPRSPIAAADPPMLLEQLGLDISAELLATDEALAPHSAAFSQLARDLASRAPAAG
jgi:hypothetical protein